VPDIVEQYRIISSGAGWTDRRRGRLRFEGTDGLMFLQALLTNDVASLVRGEGRYSVYLTPNGRMIADIELLHRGDWMLGCVPDGLAATLAQRFDQLIFAEDLRVVDASASLYEVTVLGSGAVEAVARGFGLDAGALAKLPESSQIDWPEGFVSRSGGASCPVFSVFGAADGRESAVRRLEASGVVHIGVELVEALRVAAGRPAWGAELTEQVIPLEAGLLDRAISTTKGCYVGQEIVIRMLHRGGGRVAKRLVMLALGSGLEARGVGTSEAAIPVPGAGLLDAAGTPIGTLTSVAPSLVSEGLVALGYLRDDQATIGASVNVAGSGAKAVVTGFGG
jgi:folate-binding protein YgfZ